MADPFPWPLPAWEAKVREAVKAYWQARSGQAAKQATAGVTDAGIRGEVTGGLHLDGFCNLIRELIERSGFEKQHIRLKTGVELPGYYRPSKKWDIVVIRDGRLCAAIEMKSQVGPSFGNNFNNRSEEAVGSSVDVWLAFREGRLGAQQPWIGYFFFLEDTSASTRPVGLPSPVFPVDPIFLNSSYAQRYEILCKRMVLERNYTAAALLLSPRNTEGDWKDSSPELSFLQFSRSLYGHLIGCI